MARGAAKAAETQLGTTNTEAAKQGAQASELESTLIPGYTSLMTEGYSPTQKSAMTTAGMGAAAQPFETARVEAENRAARTRNAAGTAAEADSLARSKGETMGSTAANLQKSFADQEQSNRLAGLEGLSSLYGTNTEAMTSLYGLGPQTINSWTNASQNPWLNSLIGAGGSVLTDGLSKGGFLRK